MALGGKAFCTLSGDVASVQAAIAAGRQVISWGESTFIQAGINNAINHFDVSALRVPGSELREAYLPRGGWKAVALAPRTQGEAMWRRFRAAQEAVERFGCGATSSRLAS